MRIPVDDYLARGSRGQQLADDFTVEDVWALPVHGDEGDLTLLRDQVMTRIDLAKGPAAARFLWKFRDLLGAVFGLGRIDRGKEQQRGLPIPGCTEVSLADRLPTDLRGTVTPDPHRVSPFTPIFSTDTEYLAEMSNRTVHGALHLLWVPDGNRWSGQMAVLVKPRGAFGRAYLAFIKPFRYAIVYPAMMQMIEKAAAEVRAGR